MRRRFDLTPLGHPAWWVALALLLINDNLFKGRGVVPTWLAGKLSDFAFLIVAPVLFAAMIPRRVPGRRTFAVASVVAVYVAADLSHAVSDGVVAVAARVGLHWRLWPDPTDLLALAVLPITVWLLRRTPRPAADTAAARRARVQRERAGIVLGALACLATSSLPSYPHNPFLFNRTSTATDVRITWVLRKVDCDTTPEALGAMLGPSDLDDPRSVTLGTGDVAALDGIPTAGTSPVGVCSTTRPADQTYAYGSGQYGCVAAILETPGATPVLMMTPTQWNASDNSGFISCCDNSSDPTSRCKPKLDTRQNLGDEVLSITNSGGTLRFDLTHGGPHQEGPPIDTPIQIAPIDPAAIAARPPVANGCRESRDMYHALVDTAVSCTTDGDCQSLPALTLPGEATTCAVFVNRSVSSSALQSVEAQLYAMCQTGSGYCDKPLAAVCKAGRCAEQCAGVNLPDCPGRCSYYSSYPDGTCDLYGGSCLGNDGFICTCQNQKYACSPMPTPDPTCPLMCRPHEQQPTPRFDAGARDASGDGGGPGSDGSATDGAGAADGGATEGGTTDGNAAADGPDGD